MTKLLLPHVSGRISDIDRRAMSPDESAYPELWNKLHLAWSFRSDSHRYGRDAGQLSLGGDFKTAGVFQRASLATGTSLGVLFNGSSTLLVDVDTYGPDNDSKLDNENGITMLARVKLEDGWTGSGRVFATGSGTSGGSEAYNGVQLQVGRGFVGGNYFYKNASGTGGRSSGQRWLASNNTFMQTSGWMVCATTMSPIGERIQRHYCNGVRKGNSTTSGSGNNTRPIHYTNDPYTVGAEYDGGGSLVFNGNYRSFFRGLVSEVMCWNRTLSHSEILTLTKNVHAPFVRKRRVVAFVAEAGGGDTQVSVEAGVGSGVGAGNEPSVAIGSSVNVVAAAGTGEATGQTPSASIGQQVTTQVGTGSGAGMAPSVTIAAAVSVSAGAGAGSGSGASPVASTGIAVIAARGMGEGQGQAPSVQIGGAVTVSPGSGAASGQGAAPSIIRGQSVTAGSGAGSGSGQPPGSAIGVGVSVSAGSGTGVGSGNTPSAQFGVSVTASTGIGEGSGQPPTSEITTGVGAKVGSGAGTGTGFAPTSSQGHSATVQPGAGQGVGLSPTIAIGGLVSVTVGTGEGTGMGTAPTPVVGVALQVQDSGTGQGVNHRPAFIDEDVDADSYPLFDFDKLFEFNKLFIEA